MDYAIKHERGCQQQASSTLKYFTIGGRRHSTLGYKSPMQFLDDWLVAQQKEQQVA